VEYKVGTRDRGGQTSTKDGSTCYYAATPDARWSPLSHFSCSSVQVKAAFTY
jgi:hypothetical protein